MAGNDVFLYSVPSDADRDDVRLRDPSGAAASGDVTVTPGFGTLTLTGQAPTVAASVVMEPAIDTLAITGNAPTVSASAAASPAVVALSLTGYAPDVSLGVNIAVAPATGALAITGYAPDVATGSSEVERFGGHFGRGNFTRRKKSGRQRDEETLRELEEAYAELAGERPAILAPVIAAVAPYIERPIAPVVETAPLPVLVWKVPPTIPQMDAIWRAIDIAEQRIREEEEEEDLLMLMAA